MIDVSIIIVNYNTCKMTSECIDSIVEKTHGLNYEIILVDNASTDGSKESFEKDKRLTYIYSERNGGFGYANNIGMKIAKGKYILLLNSDTLLVNNAIKEFYDYAESKDEKAVYGCYLQYLNGVDILSHFNFPAFTIADFIKRYKHHLKHKENIPMKKNVKEVEVVMGADMFFDSILFRQTGGFDENIFLYGEEGEWQYRLSKEGVRRYILPYPKIIHLGGQTTDELPHINAIQWQSHFYVLKKHMCLPTYILARFYYTLRHTLHK